MKALSQSARSLARSPGFALTAIGTLALGMAAATAVFSVANAVLLKPYVFPDAGRVVIFHNVFEGGSHGGTASPTEYQAWSQQSDLLEDFAAYSSDSANLAGKGVPELIVATRVNPGFFRIASARPLLGRTFKLDDDHPGSAKTVVLTHRFWQRRFAGDTAVVGLDLSLNGELHRIIGVMGEDFDSGQITETVLGNGDLKVDEPTDVFRPLQLDPNSSEHGHFFNVIARLKPGVTLAAANAQLATVFREYSRKWPQDVRGRAGFRVVGLLDGIAGATRRQLMILAGAVAFLLLVACANVANLLMVRATGRAREIAVRAALGASRGQIVRQLLMESVLLSAGAVVLGVAVGQAAMRALLSFNPTSIPRIGAAGEEVTLDWRVLAFSIALMTLTTLAFGLLPALQESRVDLSRVLRFYGSSVNGGRSLLRQALVMIEIALAIVLLAGAGLLFRTLLVIRHVDPGFDIRNVLTMRMSFAGPRFQGNPSEVVAVLRAGLRRIQELPGVQSAAVACCLPLEDRLGRQFRIIGRAEGPGSRGAAVWTVISPGYFETFRIPVLAGRTFREADEKGPPAVVINQAFARQFWANQDPIGRQITIGRERPRQIVGVVGNIREWRLDQQPAPAMFVLPDSGAGAALDVPWGWIIRMRPGTAVSTLGSLAREELLSISGGIPVARVRLMEDVFSKSTATQAFNAKLFGIFAASGLLLAVLGVFGLMAYSVAQRAREFAIRVALGAQPSHLPALAMKQALAPVLGGVILGLVAAFGLTRVLTSLLFEVQPLDTLVFVSVPLILAGAGLAAAWLPASRARRMDPAHGLGQGLT